MIPATTNKPKVSHTDFSTQSGKARKVAREFAKRVETMLISAIAEGFVDWDNSDGDVLLRHRKLLVSLVGKGMFEKQDKEVDIATAALVVWFNRLSLDRRSAIEDMF